MSKDSDVSAADPNDILKNMKVAHYKLEFRHKVLHPAFCTQSIFSLFISVQDMDDMDADLFALKKKPSLASVQTKALSNEGPKKESPVLGELKPEGAGKFSAECSCINCIIVIIIIFT